MGEDKHGRYTHVKDPVVLAAFIAFCSGNSHRVLLRGSCQSFPESFPSLFRDNNGFCGDPEAEKRWSAYRCVLRKLREEFKGARWDRENLGAVLQHYGIKTPWLDVVRNIHTAIWFATHTLDDGPSPRVVKRSMEEYAWISLYVDSREGRKLKVVDLWNVHSSKHVRPHAQQGLSLAMQSDPKNEEDLCPPVACASDFNTHRVARIRFPAQSEHGCCAAICSRPSSCSRHANTTTRWIDCLTLPGTSSMQQVTSTTSPKARWEPCTRFVLINQKKTPAVTTHPISRRHSAGRRQSMNGN